MSYNLLTVLGPTAVGKTRLAALIADKYNGEIISADSRQVYRFMDIGTGKDLRDYKVGDNIITAHLVDVAEPSEEFNLFRFRAEFFKAWHCIRERKNIPVMAGGTGLYLSSIIQNYDMKRADLSEEKIEEYKKYSIEKLIKKLLDLKPDQHNITDLEDKERIIKALIISESEQKPEPVEKPEINSLNIGVFMERDKIKRRITARLKQRLEEGMIKEAEKLLEMGISHEKLQFFGLEYKYLSLYLRGELNYNDMYQKLNSSIHKFAKRQMTWYRKMEKEGVKIHWIDGPDFDLACRIIEENYFE